MNHRMAKLDNADLRILRRIQADSSASLADLADEVGLSSNACWKRLRRLESEGYIAARVAILDREKFNLGVTVFVNIKTDQHEDKWLTDFSASIGRISEVVEFYRMSGDVDYMLKVVCSSISDYDRIYKKIIRSVKIKDISSFFAMEQIKSTTAIPIEVA